MVVFSNLGTAASRESGTWASSYDAFKGQWEFVNLPAEVGVEVNREESGVGGRAGAGN